MTPTWGIRAYTGEFYFVNFSKNEKIFQKSMFYGLFFSKFFTYHFYEVHFGLFGPKNTQKWPKLPKTSIFKPIFLEIGTFLEKTDTCVEFVLKSSLK